MFIHTVTHVKVLANCIVKNKRTDFYFVRASHQWQQPLAGTLRKQRLVLCPTHMYWLNMTPCCAVKGNIPNDGALLDQLADWRRLRLAEEAIGG